MYVFPHWRIPFITSGFLDSEFFHSTKTDSILLLSIVLIIYPLANLHFFKRKTRTTYNFSNESFNRKTFFRANKQQALYLREDILVFAGGVIPMQDYDFLYQAGVVAIFGPGTSVAKAACQIMEIMLEE